LYSGLDIKDLNSKSLVLTANDRQEIKKYIEQCRNNYLRLEEGGDSRDKIIQTDKFSEDDYQALVEKLKNNNFTFYSNFK